MESMDRKNTYAVLSSDTESAEELLEELVAETCQIVRDEEESDYPKSSQDVVDTAIKVARDLAYEDTLELIILSEIAEYQASEQTSAWGALSEAVGETVYQRAKTRLIEEGVITE